MYLDLMSGLDGRMLLLAGALAAVAACQAKPRHTTSDGLPVADQLNVTGDGIPVDRNAEAP